VAGELWRKSTWALTMFGDFLGILVDFLGFRVV
jgi:hypothetical protein